MRPTPVSHVNSPSTPDGGRNTAAVLDVNDAPVVDLNGQGAGTSATAAYRIGNPLTKIAPNATVLDSDSVDFQGGSLRIGISLNGTSTDRLAIITDGTVTLTG